MVGSKALAQAQVNLAGTTDVVRSLPISGPVTALFAVPLLRGELGAVNGCCCVRWRWVSSVPAWLLLGRQLLQQLVHELLSKIELAGTNAPAGSRPTVRRR